MMGKNVNKNKGKTWTPKDIRSYMKNFVSTLNEEDRIVIGDTVNTIPITIDGRLKTSLGYFSGIYKRNGEFVSPVKFKFSKRMNVYDDDTIKHIISHELMHLLSDKKHKKNTAHGEEWKECCHKYGVNDDEFFESNLELEKDYYRYHIYCQKCGKLIGTKDRLSKAGIIELLLYGKHTVDYGILKIYDSKEGKYLNLNNIMVNDDKNN
ncbi:MAG: SprT-like domain-containing protein [Clostridia bacterium]